MNTLHQYNHARTVIEGCFNGLPHAPRILVNALITKADLSTGRVENINYRDLAACLTVAAAPGRKDSGTPTKQAVRNYLNTIQTQCGDHFQLSSVGQSLKITFPTLPDIYKAYVELPEVNTVSDRVSNTAATLTNTDSEAFFEELLNTEEPTEVHTEVNTLETIEATNVGACASAKIKIKNKTNKLTNLDVESFADLRQPIDRDFYPNQETIELARAKGLVKVTSDLEIKRFVMYNLASSTRWADFNPIFINWLERDHSRDAEKTITTTSTQHNARTNHHEQRSTHQSPSRKPTVADSIAQNQRIIDEANKRQTDIIIDCEYLRALDLNDCTLQQLVHQ